MTNTLPVFISTVEAPSSFHLETCRVPRLMCSQVPEGARPGLLERLVFSELIQTALEQYEMHGLSPALVRPPAVEAPGTPLAEVAHLQAFLCDYAFQRLHFLKQVLFPRADVSSEDLIWSLCHQHLVSEGHACPNCVEEEPAGQYPPVGAAFRFDSLYQEMSDPEEPDAVRDMAIPLNERPAPPASPADPFDDESSSQSNEVPLLEPVAFREFLTTVGADDARFSYIQTLRNRRKMPLAYAPDDIALSSLQDSCPNFTEVLAYVRRQAHMCRAGGIPFRVPPLLLLGPPGVGKTHFARALSDALTLDFKLIPVNAMSAGFTLTGMHRTWQRATPGLVSKTLLEARHGNALMLLDEIEKSERTGPHGSPVDSLYQLLEPETSRTFKDEFFDLPMDASHLVWIATANSTDTMPDALLSRFKTFQLRPLTPQETLHVAEKLLLNLLATYRLSFDSTLCPDCAKALQSFSPRDLRMVLADAVGHALFDGRSKLTPCDLRNASTSLQTRTPIGFAT